LHIRPSSALAARITEVFPGRTKHAGSAVMQDLDAIELQLMRKLEADLSNPVGADA